MIFKTVLMLQNGNLRGALDRDARTGSLITRLASTAVKVGPDRRETLLRRAERLAAYRRHFWTPERLRATAQGKSLSELAAAVFH